MNSQSFLGIISARRIAQARCAGGERRLSRIQAKRLLCSVCPRVHSNRERHGRGRTHVRTASRARTASSSTDRGLEEEVRLLKLAFSDIALDTHNWGLLLESQMHRLRGRSGAVARPSDCHRVQDRLRPFAAADRLQTKDYALSLETSMNTRSPRSRCPGALQQFSSGSNLLAPVPSALSP